MGFFGLGKKKDRDRVADSQRSNPSLSSPPLPVQSSPSFTSSASSSRSPASSTASPPAPPFAAAPSRDRTGTPIHSQHSSSVSSSTPYSSLEVPPVPVPQRSASRATALTTSNSSWDDLGVPLVTSPAPASPTTSDLGGAPSRSHLFGVHAASSTHSLPLLPSPRSHPELPTAVAPAGTASKLSRWGFGARKAKTRSGSVASMLDLPEAGKDKENGFVVRSFRQVSHVREDPISPGPYESLPLLATTSTDTAASSPPLPPLPALSSPPERPPLNVRGPASRSASPTISVEQFRLASQSRSRSTASLLSLDSQPSHQPPRFEPTPRSRQGSVDLSAPRPSYFVPQHNRSDSRLTASESVASVASVTSYATAHEGLGLTTSKDVDLGLSEDLKLIALYGAGDPSPPLAAVDLPPPLANPRVGALSPPAVAVQPASPVASTASTDSPRRQHGNLSPSSAAAAAKGKPAPRGFASWTTSSDSESDNGASSDEDDVPLARLSASRSQENLAAFLHPVTQHARATSSPASSQSQLGVASSQAKHLSGEVEVLQGPQLSSSPTLVERPSSIRAQQRSVSTLSFSNSRSTLSGPSPPSPNLGPRTHSNPSTTSNTPSAPLAFAPSPTQLAATTPYHSSSSSSGSGSGPSLPSTPKDGDSPGASVVGQKPPAERTIRFHEDSTLERERKSRQRLSALPSQQSFHQRGLSSSSSMHPPRGILPPRSASALGYAPAVLPPQQPQAQAKQGDVFDRMKSRHKTDVARAEKIGRDLNGPGGVVPDSESDDDDEAPLAALTQRSRTTSATGHAYGAPQPFFQASPLPTLSGYSPLALAPPGVDPYLYASLPPDQKMSLHQRSQQMMAMMAEAAYHAKAESMGGWETGSNVSGASSSAGPPRPTHVPQSMSMGHLGQMWPPAPMLFSPYGPSPTMNLPRLPSFAPPISASQQFFQNHAYPGYGGSALGLPTAPSSMAGRAGQRKPPASTVGYSSRR